MARRDDRHHHQSQQQLHYATVIPSNVSKSSTNGHNSHESPAVRKQTELERAKALYVDFDDAFQDETTNHDYFGFKSPYSPPEPTENDSQQQTGNFYLQSVETISEVKNTNLSPFIRQHTSRENSRPSTPSDTPSYPSRSNHHRHQLSTNSSSSSNHHSFNSNDMTNLGRDFTNLNIIHPDDLDDSSAPFTPDDTPLKFIRNQYDRFPIQSSEFKLILPQYFLVKYLGRVPCSQLWGATVVRAPIDKVVHSARQLPSMSEVPTLEACINPRGLTLTHRHSPSHTKRHHSPERHQHGLIPLDYISYVMHDIQYSKICACIVIRQSKKSSSEKKASNQTVTECYTFLFQSKDHAHRFALSLAEAFNAQIQSSTSAPPTKGTKPSLDEKRDGHSPPRRSKHRTHHHEKARRRYDDTYLRDSEV